MNNGPEKKTKKDSKLAWSLLSVVLAVGTVWVVLAHGGEYSPGDFADFVGEASAPYLMAAVLCMAGFIIFEGLAVMRACGALGCRVRLGQGIVYSASDIYFSAITPSATGGQPVCAYFMMRDGLPASVTTIALLLNLVMYTASILFIAIINAVLHTDMFAAFDGLSRTLIVIGYLIQTMFGVLLLLLLFKEALLHRICRGVIKFLCRVRLLRREEEKLEKLEAYIEEYEELSAAVAGKKWELVKVFLLNLAQRVSVISVSAFVFLAEGGKLSKAVDIWAIQCYSVVGSNSVPIPGAMGVADYIMLDGFAKLLPEEDVVSFELLSRGISFYACVIVCGLIALLGYFIQKKRER